MMTWTNINENSLFESTKYLKIQLYKEKQIVQALNCKCKE